MVRREGPRSERGRRTRAAILDATWDLIETVGGEGTTMAAVAERAGITRRALYLHFPSRAELLVALHAHVDERLDLPASAGAIAQAPDAVTALRAFAAHLARFHSRIARVDSALLRSADTDAEAASVVDEGVAVWHRACCALADRLAREGALADPWTTEAAADLLWSFMFPETLTRLTEQRGWSQDRYAHLLGVILVRTLVADAPPPRGSSRAV
jgi:AcrR family transcriptional regulator